MQARGIEESPQIEQDAARPARLTVRLLVLAALFTFAGSWWGIQTSLMTFAGNILVAVPPIPTLATLLLFVALTPLLRRISRNLALSRAEILFLYAISAIGVQMASIGVVRMMMPCLSVPFYFATPANHFEPMQEHIPWFVAPKDMEVIRQMHEGSDDGSVPWGAWLVPLGYWSALMLVIYVTTLSLSAIMRPQWSEREKLSYPLVELALRVTGARGESGGAWLLRNPVMWAGFSIGLVFNVFNILKAFNPAVPALGNTYDVGALFTEHPWSAIRPLTFYHRPDIVGLGYLVPLDVGMTIWISYLLLRVSRVVVASLGREAPRWPYEGEQSVGAYVVLAGILVWIARDHLRQVLRRAWTGVSASDRLSVIGAAAGFALTVWMGAIAGMYWVTSLAFFTMIYACAFVYSRIRAEAGTPLITMYPWEEQRIFVQSLGGKLLTAGKESTITILATMHWLGTGHFPELMGYQLEDLEMSRRANLNARHMTYAILFALVVGLASAYWLHLVPYYQYGCNVLEGGTTQGGYRTDYARMAYERSAEMLVHPGPPDWGSLAAIGAGGALVAVLAVFRMAFLRFPISPLGYAMAAAWGLEVWGPFFLVSVAKMIVLRLGGARLHRRMEPAFLGLAIGHFFGAGILWGALAFLGNDLWRFYHVTFD
jgi:hypothetical protein